MVYFSSKGAVLFEPAFALFAAKHRDLVAGAHQPDVAYYQPALAFCGLHALHVAVLDAINYGDDGDDFVAPVAKPAGDLTWPAFVVLRVVLFCLFLGECKSVGPMEGEGKEE